MRIKAVFFDLYGTLAYAKNPINSEEISEFLLKHGCEIYPQSLDAASYFVSMIDYPKHGYDNWEAYLKQVLHRLGINIDANTLEELVVIYQRRRNLTLFPDAALAVKRAKELNLQTAIVTTIAHFCFSSAIQHIQQHFDVITTGYEAGCEKSNPRMHRHTLRKLGVLPEEAAMIGDELLVDIKIPKKLGMHTIQLDRTGKIRAKHCDADAKAKTLLEAIDIIEKWLRM